MMLISNVSHVEIFPLHKENQSMLHDVKSPLTQIHFLQAPLLKPQKKSMQISAGWRLETKPSRKLQTAEQRRRAFEEQDIHQGNTKL